MADEPTPGSRKTSPSSRDRNIFENFKNYNEAQRIIVDICKYVVDKRMIENELCQELDDTVQVDDLTAVELQILYNTVRRIRAILNDGNIETDLHVTYKRNVVGIRIARAIWEVQAKYRDEIRVEETKRKLRMYCNLSNPTMTPNQLKLSTQPPRKDRQF